MSSLLTLQKVYMVLFQTSFYGSGDTNSPNVVVFVQSPLSGYLINI